MLTIEFEGRKGIIKYSGIARQEAIELVNQVMATGGEKRRKASIERLENYLQIMIFKLEAAQGK